MAYKLQMIRFILQNQMEYSQIFQESESQEKANFVTYSDTLKGDKYVSQFLNDIKVGKDLELNEPYVEDAEEIVEFEEYLVDVSQEPQIRKKKSQKKSRAECSFHNFQKHLVTTIRYNIFVEDLEIPEALKDCVFKLWEAFKNSKKLNKTLICMILTDLHSQNPHKVAEYGFGHLLEEFPIQIMSQSQKFLSEHINTQMHSLNLQKILVHRRMKNKQDFILYFKQFLKEADDGLLQKRMIKCTKLVKKLKQIRKYQNQISN